MKLRVIENGATEEVVVAEDYSAYGYAASLMLLMGSALATLAYFFGG
jgi:hypothetical protein